MKKDCKKSLNGENEIPCKFHRISELSTTITQERWHSFKAIQQDKVMKYIIERLEHIDISEHAGSEGDIQVEVDDNKEQADPNYDSLNPSNISNGYQSDSLGSSVKAARSGSGSLALKQVESKFALNKSQLQRICRYSLQASPFHETFKRKIDKITEDRDRKQLSCIQHQSGFSCGSIGKTYGQNFRNSSNSQSPTSCVPHTRRDKQDTRLIVRINNLMRLFTTPRSLRSGTSCTQNSPINRHICHQIEQNVEVDCQPAVRQQVNRTRLSAVWLDERTMIASPSNSN
ncbi:MAG: hypothetical protein EZS28_022046, partial [Streblomastix strix]